LAAAVHPKFKLDWVDDPTAKAQLVELLKHLVQQTAGNQATTEVQADQPPTTTTTDFFARLAAKRQSNIDGRVDVASEVEKYTSDNSAEISSLVQYPHIRQWYLQLNTGLPASAAVERLFSGWSCVFSFAIASK